MKIKRPKIETHYDCLDVNGKRKSIHEVKKDYTNMIDELIECYSLLDQMKDDLFDREDDAGVYWNDKDERMYSIKEVLKNSGCDEK